MFKSFRVTHTDGTKGRVIREVGDYYVIGYRENGKDETIEIRKSLLGIHWHY